MSDHIETDDQYETVLAVVYNLIQKEDRSDEESNELLRLSILIHEYELKYYPMLPVQERRE